MAPHSSILAWQIPWVEEPGRLQSMGSLRVRYDWATSLWLFTFMRCRRKWHPTPVFLPGESQGRGSLVGCHLWGRTESDTTEATQQQQQQQQQQCTSCGQSCIILEGMIIQCEWVKRMVVEVSTTRETGRGEEMQKNRDRERVTERRVDPGKLIE